MEQNENQFFTEHDEFEKIPDLIADTATKNFGITYLYPWQRLVIANILDSYENRESEENICNEIVLLPTGAGKSLCFMVPAVLLPGPTLVLYPLLALMSDQMRRMEDAGLSQAIFRGQQSQEDRENNFRKIEDGAKIVLANPEVLQSENLIERLCKYNISHIAIDEAHCVSEWGDSFRPAYLNLGKVIQKLKAPVVTAFTATASKEVLERISEVLFDGNAHIVRSESDRPNIHYSVIPCYAKQKELLLLVQREKRPMVIFCSTRKRTENIAREIIEFLGENDTVRFYHGGLQKIEKDETEKWFHPKKDAIQICTCAWGMGVDKKDIRTVIHLDPPLTAEAYIQEAGRGGRDGEISKAILLWSGEDSRKTLNLPYGSRQRVIADFAESTTCRRQVLLDALGGEQAPCDGCDICKGERNGVPNDALKFIRFLNRYGKCFEVVKALDMLRQEFNIEAEKKLGMRIWTESDIKQIYTELIEENRIKVDKILWRGRLDIGKNKTKWT